MGASLIMILRVKLKVALGSANVPSAKPIWLGSKVRFRFELSRVPTTLNRSKPKRESWLIPIAVPWLASGTAPPLKLSISPLVLSNVPPRNRGKLEIIKGLLTLLISAKLLIFWATSAAKPKSRELMIKPAALVRISPTRISAKKLLPRIGLFPVISLPTVPLLSSYSFSWKETRLTLARLYFYWFMVHK